MAKNATNNLTAGRAQPKPARAPRAAPGASARSPRFSTATAPTRSTFELDAHDFSAVLSALWHQRGAHPRHRGQGAARADEVARDSSDPPANIQHADLLVVRRGEKVTVEVNVVVEGEAAYGTLVTQDANTITIEADVQSIPDHLTVSVEGRRDRHPVRRGRDHPSRRCVAGV